MRGLNAKFLLIYLLFVLLPTMAFGAWFYVSEAREIQSRVLTGMEEEMDAVARTMDAAMQGPVEAIQTLQTNRTLQRILKGQTNEASWGKQYDDLLEITDILAAAQNSLGVESIHLYLDASQFYAHQNWTFRSLESLRQTAVYEQLRNLTGYAWQYTEAVVEPPWRESAALISAFGLLTEWDTQGKRSEMVIETTLPLTALSSVMERSAYHSRVISWLENAQGERFLPLSGELPSEPYDFLIRKPLVLSGWTLCVAGTMESLAPMVSVFDTNIGYILPLVILSFVVSSLFFWRIDRRLKHITHWTGGIAHYWDVPDLAAGPEDSIGALSLRLNDMLATIRSMFDNVQRISEQKRRTEMELLLSQVNPHFLYNALDALNWRAVDHELYDLSRSITQVSKFLRSSLHRRTQTADLSSELEQIDTYLCIQRDMLSIPFTWSIDPPGELAGMPMLRFVLQPLVENALLHGILERNDGEGHISLRLQSRVDSVTFWVEDNGVGMSAEKIADILREVNLEAGSRYFALHNVHQRLVMQYGPQSSLQIASEPYVKTTIRFHIPLAGQSRLPTA